MKERESRKGLVDAHSGVRAPRGGETASSRHLDRLGRRGDLFRELGGGRVECTACALGCRIGAGNRGVCQVRYNRDGALIVPWGYAASLQCDPVEKKPFYHVLPGEKAFTFGMLGCDMHCPYCQNWQIAQSLRDPHAAAPGVVVSAAQVVEMALRSGARCLASSYNEPLISAEWGREIFTIGKEHGLTNLFVSNGNASPEVLAYLRPILDAIKIDLKSMRPENYRRLGGVLNFVLDGIQMAVEMGFWVEIVTLLVPGFNDAEEELGEMAGFILSLGANIPWHVTAFQPMYKMSTARRTPAAALRRAVEIGYDNGLHFVYAGNLPGGVGRYENTYCPSCGALLVERGGYVIRKRTMGANGRCGQCGRGTPGIWG